MKKQQDTIPKKIHLCWLSGDTFPPLISHCIESWRKHMPDYEIVVWDTNRFDLNSSKWVKQAFEAKKYAFAADYIRLHALDTQGGIYLDSDVEVFKSFDSFIHHNTFMGLESSGDFEPAIIGAQKGAQWIKEVKEYYKDRDFIDEVTGKMDIRPLPMIVGEILAHNHKITPQVGEYAQIGLRVYPCDYFSPKSSYTNKFKLTSDTFSVHHFDGKWVRKDFKYYAKKIVHRTLVLLLGKTGHRKMVEYIRKR